MTWKMSGMKINKLMTPLLLLACGITMAQATMAPTQKKSILIVNATAHLGNGKVIPKSLVGIADGKIKEVFNANVVKAENLSYDTLIQAEGKHLYPGFIAVNTTLGLREIDQVRATHDYAETGSMNPNVRSIIAYNTDSRIIPTVRSNGVLYAQVSPRGGKISGTSSVVELDGWNWEEAVYRENDGVHLNWPKYRVEDPNRKKNKKDSIDIDARRRAEIRELTVFFNDAKAYLNASYQYEVNLRFESMRGVFNGEKRIYVHANHMREISEAVYFKRDLGIRNMVIVGGSDAWRVVEFLKDHDIPVVVRRPHSLPSRPDEDIDLPYKLPALLEAAGVLCCIDNEGRMETMNTRNLPFWAGTCSAYGLGEERAIQSITLNAAKILGIDKTTGSIEAGKDASLFISSGNALDALTNHVELAWIKGRQIDLDNAQKQLYLKYKAKYERRAD
ncbi:MAG: amidohydrolase family protein [Vicingaceae bacterium]